MNLPIQTKHNPSLTTPSHQPINHTHNTPAMPNDAAAKHALEHTTSWKPSLDRRQSWNKEDRKRALQMAPITGEHGQEQGHHQGHEHGQRSEVGEPVNTGFSETGH